MLFRLIVKPYRKFLRPSYKSRPLASSVLRSYIRKRNHPSWTSYFIEYRQIQDDNFGQKHFNFMVDGHNYHILRVGCFPYIKYHCTKRPVQDLTAENNLFRLITVLNLGIPCILYGLAAICLIKHTDKVVDEETGKTPFHRDMVSTSYGLEYRPTGYFWLILILIFSLIYLSGKVVGCFVSILLRVLRGTWRFLLWDTVDYYEEKRKIRESGLEVKKVIEEREARREEARKKRREERRRIREEAKEELKALLESQTNGNLKQVLSKASPIQEGKLQPSDNSDSPTSEYEDENSQATSGIVLSDLKPNFHHQILHHSRQNGHKMMTK